MRADRLLSLLMLLQTHGRMSAKALAERLEVSERTIHRDIDALSAAGVPVYGEAGRAGGFDLLDSYKTTLTGLNEKEVRALFMLSIPAPLSDLGLSDDLQTALLKLSAALPDAYRQDEADVRQRFHLDSTWWHQLEEPIPFLGIIESAVWSDRRLKIRYRLLFALEMERVVEPYGLVAKAGVWYLVYAGGGRVRAYGVADLLDAQLTDESFERPQDFDLGAFWKRWCAEREGSRSDYPVTVRAAERLIPELLHIFGNRVREKIAQAGPVDAEGWITLELSFESPPAARSRLLGFGNAIEVLEPLALRRSIEDYAKQIVKLYAN